MTSGFPAAPSTRRRRRVAGGGLDERSSTESSSLPPLSTQSDPVFSDHNLPAARHHRRPLYDTHFSTRRLTNGDASKHDSGADKLLQHTHHHHTLVRSTFPNPEYRAKDIWYRPITRQSRVRRNTSHMILLTHQVSYWCLYLIVFLRMKWNECNETAFVILTVTSKSLFSACELVNEFFVTSGA